ncbi:BTB/POZ domain-containing protein [Glycine soja]|uniref:BTB/POZ domain-containing protein n=1 Tax=Glycine soja TaxID=3848 RepID=A0A445IFL0_GLYSO|nr:BTB/POZ domain-containing protein [Glycine soja]
MKSDREKEKENNRCISSHMQTKQIFLQIAVEVNKRKKRSAVWRFFKKDMADLLGSSLDYNAYGREPVADILGAHYYGFFNAKVKALLSMASDVAVKVISFIPNSLFAIPSCAIALNLVISNLSATSEKAVMETLKETETSMRIVGNRKDFAEGAKKIEYFEETTFLLSAILWRWPPSRFPVGNDVILMKVLANIHTRTDKATPFSKLFLLQFHSIPYKSLTRTYPLCKNPFFTFPASYIRILGSENVPCAILFQVQIAVEVNKRKKSSAVRRFLKKDMADLLGSSLDYNAYGRFVGVASLISLSAFPRVYHCRTCCRYFGSALLWVLQCKSEALLSMASDVAVKVISFIPNSLLQFHMLDLVYCLSSLLSSHQVEVATPCAIALNLVISNLSATSEKAVMEALKETETSMRIVGNRKDFAEGAKKIEYFEETTLLLSTILWRWPPSRFPVALCDSVARKLIEDGEVFPQMFVLAQCLLRSQANCLKVVGLCGEALVDAIICGMTETGLSSK